MGWFILSFIGLFYAVGFGLLGYAAFSAYRSTQARNWPTARGTINSVELVEQNSDGTTWTVKVDYQYVVDGTQYVGQRIAFGYAGSSGRKPHEEIHDKLKAAKTVDVRYNPDKPWISTLSYGLHGSIYAIFIFALIWLTFMLGFTLLLWISGRSDGVLLNNLSVQ